MCGESGEPLLSWRVLILPYIEGGDLYKKFRLNEPWDSEHNIRLLPQMPSVYEAPWTKIVDVPPHHTVLHALVGRGTAFEEGKKLRVPDDFPEQGSQTILFVEAGKPVPWTKPDEIVYDPQKPLRLQGLFKKGFRAGMVDGSRRFIGHDTSPEELRRLITRNHGKSLLKD